MQKLNRTGEKHFTKKGDEVEIIEYFSAINCTVRFKDEFNTTLYNVTFHHTTKGNFKNPNGRTVHGVGYMGIGDYKSRINYKATEPYSFWERFIYRCYSKWFQQKISTYMGCSVDERWHNFQVFAQWFEENYNPETMQGWQLDKDILVKGNKIYSPETCCFVPAEINNLFVKSNSSRGKYPIGVSFCKSKKKFVAQLKRSGGTRLIGRYNTIEEAFQAYKTAKEEYIKEVADKWRGQITEKCYQAMYNYKVEITD